MASTDRTRNPSTMFAAPANPDGSPALSLGYDAAYAAGSQAPMSNLSWTGTMGWAPNQTNWASSQPYVGRNLISILMEPPRGFQVMPEPDKWILTLKSLVETVPTSITGLNAGLELTTDSVAYGGDGSVFEVPTDCKRVVTDVNMTFYERNGLPIFRYFDYWIRLFIMDPITKVAMVNTIPTSKVTDLFADQYAMTMLFIEPDPSNRYVNQAWLVTNMFPKGTGENSAKRDMAGGMQRRDITIQFAGIAQYGVGVDAAAQAILDTYRITGADPHAREAFMRNVSARIRETDKADGYKRTIDEISRQNQINHPGRFGEAPAGSAVAGNPVRP